MASVIFFLYHLCVLIYLCISVVCCRRSTLNIVCSCFTFTTEPRRQPGKRRRRRRPEKSSAKKSGIPISSSFSLHFSFFASVLPMARGRRELTFCSDPGSSPENGKRYRHFDSVLKSIIFLTRPDSKIFLARAHPYMAGLDLFSDEKRTINGESR